jgi:hypothetical protein
MDGLEGPKVHECLLQNHDGVLSNDTSLIAIIEESDKELCLVVSDHISWSRVCVSGVFLWGNTTSSPGRLCIQHKVLKSIGIANVGEANDDDSMYLEVLEMKANDRVETLLLNKC